MSAYAASISPSATSAVLNISPSSTFQLRIARIEFCATAAAILAGGATISVSYSVLVIPTGTLSSGTTVTPVPMLAGSPASAATVKSGGTVTGTAFTLHTEKNLNSNGDTTGTSSPTIVAQLNSNYSPAFELIVANGSIVQISAASSLATPLTVVVYFEEIRTPRTL